MTLSLTWKTLIGKKHGSPLAPEQLHYMSVYNRFSFPGLLREFTYLSRPQPWRKLSLSYPQWTEILSKTKRAWTNTTPFVLPSLSFSIHFTDLHSRVFLTQCPNICPHITCSTHNVHICPYITCSTNNLHIFPQADFNQLLDELALLP